MNQLRDKKSIPSRMEYSDGRGTKGRTKLEL